MENIVLYVMNLGHIFRCNLQGRQRKMRNNKKKAYQLIMGVKLFLAIRYKKYLLCGTLYRMF